MFWALIPRAATVLVVLVLLFFIAYLFIFFYVELIIFLNCVLQLVFPLCRPTLILQLIILKSFFIVKRIPNVHSYLHERVPRIVLPLCMHSFFRLPIVSTLSPSPACCFPLVFTFTLLSDCHFSSISYVCYFITIAIFFIVETLQSLLLPMITQFWMRVMQSRP